MTSATIGGVLRRPNVARTLAPSIIARLPYGAMELLLVLRLTTTGHTYGQAGLVAGAYAAALAVCAPLLARFVDRFGQTAVLVPTALTGGLATVALAVVPGSTPLVLFMALAAINGALQPPLSGTTRALWDVLLDRPDERHVAYSLDAVAVEFVFTGGPLILVGAIAGFAGAQAALLAAAAFTAAGTLAFAASPASRAWLPSPSRTASVFGPLRSRGVRTLMLVSVGAGGAFGMINVSVAAFARADGSVGMIGLLLATWSGGSLIGGLLATARLGPPQDVPRRIVSGLALMGAGNALLALAPSPAVLAVLLFLAGATIAPTFAVANATVGLVAPDGTLTEAFAWTVGTVMIGITVCAPLAGLLVDHVSVAAAFAASGVPPAAAALVVASRRSTLRSAAPASV